jgi:hypothetical protein
MRAAIAHDHRRAVPVPPQHQGFVQDGALEQRLAPDLSARIFAHQRLYRHTFACIARPDRPLGGRRLPPDAFRALGHVVMTAPSRSGQLLESWLERHGIGRRIVLRTGHCLSLPPIIQETDLTAAVPLAVAMRFAPFGAVQLLPFPFPPLFEVSQHWHRRFHDSTAGCARWPAGCSTKPPTSGARWSACSTARRCGGSRGRAGGRRGERGRDGSRG